MLFDKDNDNDVILNAREMYVLYNGHKFHLVGHAKEMTKTARQIGRCGLYHFYLDEEGKGFCIYGYKDM